MNAIAIIRLIFKHGGDYAKIASLIADAKAVVAGPGWVADRLAPSHRILDVTYPIADDLYAELGKVEAMPTDAYVIEHEELRERVATVGVGWGDMLTLVQLVIQLIEVIRNSGKPVEQAPANDLA